jgi:hypothetical protein
MTVLVTPTNGPWSATLNVPADGESVNSASVVGYMQEVANRLEYLRQRTPGANPVANLIELFPEIETANLSGVTDWILSSVGALGGFPTYATLLQQAIAQTAVKVSFPLDKFLRTGMIIRAMSVDFNGKTGHAALPATRPTLYLHKFPRSTGTAYASFYTPGNLIPATLIDSQADLSANTAAYEVMHSISKTLAAPETVDLANWTYLLSIGGEYGANALANSFMQRASISVSA